MARQRFVILDRDGKALADRDTGEQFMFPTREAAQVFVMPDKGEAVAPQRLPQLDRPDRSD